MLCDLAAQDGGKPWAPKGQAGFVNGRDQRDKFSFGSDGGLGRNMTKFMGLEEHIGTLIDMNDGDYLTPEEQAKQKAAWDNDKKYRPKAKKFNFKQIAQYLEDNKKNILARAKG